jgi:chitosanase
MQLTALQKAASQAIVNIFETGSVRGDYGDVTLLRGDSGQLTYGRSQTTLASGNLFLLCKDYSARPDGAYSAKFTPYLPPLEACDTALNNNMEFRGLLKDAGDDPVMHEVQDAFFDRVYWDPAMRSADALGAQTALGATIVYDSTVHGSWARIREMTRQKVGELSAIGEKKWMAAYVDTRHDWLANHPNALLHKTVYRMDALAALIRAGNWTLKLPFTVRGLNVTPEALGDTTVVRVPAETAPRRLLRLKSPPMTGPDVSWVQERLARAGIRVTASGTFDNITDAAVRNFQGGHGLKVDGVVGPVTRTALEDISVATKAASTDEPMPAVANAEASAVKSSTPPARDTSPSSPPPPKRSPPPQPLPEPEPAPVPTPAPAPRPARTTPPPPPSSDDGGDPVGDIKRHVSTEVRASVDAMKRTLRDEHEKLTQRVTSTVQDEVSDVLATLRDRLAVRGQAVLKDIAGGRPVIPAVLSGVTLLFTEARDFFSWKEAQTTTPAASTTSAPADTTTAPAPAVTDTTAAPATVPTTVDHTTSAPSNDTLAQAYDYVHKIAASIPNEWIFRLRIVAFALIAYAIFRLWQRRQAAAKPK